MISVITPMYNEQACIAYNIQQIVHTLEDISGTWELLIVDDGSTDNSLKICREAAKKEKRIKIISYKPNRGRGYALRQGFAYAKGDVIITTESDLSWGADIIKKLFSSLKKTDADIVIASPHKKGGGFVHVPVFRVFLTTVFNKFFGKAFSRNLTMLSGMTRAYKRKVIEALDLNSDGKEIHLEIISKAHALGFKTAEIPAILKWTGGKNKGRKSNFNVIKLTMSHLMLSLSEGPLFLLGSLGALFLLIGIISAFYAFHLWLTVSLADHLPLVIFTLIMISMGIQTLVFSFLAYQNKELRNEIFRIQSKLLQITKKK